MLTKLESLFQVASKQKSLPEEVGVAFMLELLPCLVYNMYLTPHNKYDSYQNANFNFKNIIGTRAGHITGI